MLENGYELLKNYVSPDKLNVLSNSLSLHDIGERKGGIRNIEKKNKAIYEFCYSKDMLSLARQYLGDDAKLVRSIYFNKTQRNNWLVPWHQDKTVAVSKKFEATDWTSWSIKDGEHHVQAPIDVLNQISR